MSERPSFDPFGPNTQWGAHQTGFDTLEGVQKVVLVAWNPTTLEWVKLHTNAAGDLNVTGGGGGGGAVTISDGADVTEGSTSDVAITSDVGGTVSGKLRGLVKMIASVWDSVNGVLKTKAALGLPIYDYAALVSAATTDTWTYRLGGAVGSVVATVVVTYTDSTKATILTVLRT
jgi:hypothetical protein